MKSLILSSAFFVCLCPFLTGQSVGNRTTTTTESKDAKGLDVYCGVYKMTENPYIQEVKLIEKDGQLMSKTPENEEILLDPTDDDDVFFISIFKAKIVFHREKNAIKSVKVFVQGKEMTGEKL
jgi:hypothetical protein